jgi:hypothetical protein
MAQLTTSLTLTATDPVSGIFNLNNTTVDSLGYDHTTVTSQSVSVATGSPTVIIASSVTHITYAYVKNTDTTNIVVLYTDAGVAYADLGPGEWAFLPVKGTVGLEAKAAGGACVIDYAIFKKL